MEPARNTVDAGGADDRTNESEQPQSKPRRPLRRLVILLLIGYLATCVMLAALQRYLIYYPLRESNIRPADAGLPDGRVYDVHTTTGDGLDLNGWLVLADGAAGAGPSPADAVAASSRPLVLYFSGNAANRRYRVPELQVFTGIGVDVLLIDYRGYGDNPGSPSEMGLAADATAVWKYATQTLEVPADRIVVFGESLGGGVAARLVAEQCQAGAPPAGLIVRSTFSSLGDAAAYHYPWLPVRLFLIDRFPSTERIAAVTCPILIIHGARDRIVPIRLGRRLHDAAPEQSEAGIPKRFTELSAAGHNDILYVSRAEYSNSLEEFVSRLAQP